MLYATGLTDKARQEWREYLEPRLRHGCNADVFLSEISGGGTHGASPEYGCNYEVAGRYTVTGNPLAFNVPASDYVWTDDGEADEPVLEGSFTLHFTVFDGPGLVAEAERIVAEEGNAHGAESALDIYREEKDAAKLAFTLDVICGYAERVSPFYTLDWE